MIRIFGSILFLGFAIPAFSANEPIPILDENGVLATSDQFLGTKSFAQAYKTGDQSTYLDTRCGETTCRLVRVTKTVTAVNDSSVSITNLYEDGTKDQFQVSPSLYASNRNFLKVFLANLQVTPLDPGSVGTTYSLVLDSADWLVLAQPDGYGNSSTNVLDVKFRIHARLGNLESDSPYRLGLLQGAPGLRDVAYIYSSSPMPMKLLLN